LLLFYSNEFSISSKRCVSSCYRVSKSTSLSQGPNLAIVICDPPRPILAVKLEKLRAQEPMSMGSSRCRRTNPLAGSTWRRQHAKLWFNRSAACFTNWNARGSEDPAGALAQRLFLNVFKFLPCLHVSSGAAGQLLWSLGGKLRLSLLPSVRTSQYSEFVLRGNLLSTPLQVRCHLSASPHSESSSTLLAA
jgi:hypothetical protein